MLSFLQQFGKRSYPVQSTMTRSESGESAISHPATRKTSDNASTAPSPTPPTSLTDTASEPTNPAEESKANRRSSQRLRQVPSSVGNYNENVLCGSARRGTRRKSGASGSRTISGKTFVNGEVESQELFVQESMQNLNREWSLVALPGNDLKTSLGEEKELKRRKSTRLEVREIAVGMAEIASGVVEKTKSVLGKRGRETLDAGMEKLQRWKEGRKDSLRPRIAEASVVEESPAKRAQFPQESSTDSSTAIIEQERKVIRPTRTKRWVTQGLYVGQDRDFDPRLTETKNRLKRSSSRSSSSHQRSLLPLPMFAGQRMLELERNFRLPFDVFSPLPPGQPKPEEWKKTHKSK